jgi:hypothetical protein
MPYEAPFDAKLIDDTLVEARTAHDLRTRAHLFRKSAALSWGVSWAANQELNRAAESHLPRKELQKVVARINGDWRLLRMAIFQESVALELCLKAVVAKRTSYDQAENCGHKLMEMARAIDANCVEAHETTKTIIWHLEQALLWQGRYPAPRKISLTRGDHRRPHTKDPKKSAMAGALFHNDKPAIDAIFQHFDNIAESERVTLLDAYAGASSPGSG